MEQSEICKEFGEAICTADTSEDSSTTGGLENDMEDIALTTKPNGKVPPEGRP